MLAFDWCKIQSWYIYL